MAFVLRRSKHICTMTRSLMQKRNNGFWSQLEMGPPDAILGLTEAWRKDSNEKKVNIGVGAYRDDNGKPYVLPVVRKAEEIILEKCMNHEYAPISGISDFTECAVRLALGDDCKAIEEERYATVQTISGTGSLRIGANFAAKFMPCDKVVYVSKPTWGNHNPVFKSCGLDIKQYSYYNPECMEFDMDNCVKDLCKLPEKSLILMHACAHNPTGIDPTKEEWNELSQIAKEKNFLIFFDMAYQGFASGDFERDAYSVRRFIEDGNDIILSQSFAKNMGLYGQRVGTLTVIGDSKKNAAIILSQLKIIIRAMYSSPPVHGARIATEILQDDKLKEQWFCEVKGMADRIISVRKLLRKNLEEAGSSKSWKHITSQIGMFAYTGLKADQVERLIKEFSIYMTKDGRISMAGVTTKNVKYIAEAFKAVTE